MKKTTIALAIITALPLMAAEKPVKKESLLSNLSVEALGVIRYQGTSFDKGEDYGVGVGIGYRFNKYVSGQINAISYSNEDWGGGTVDEGSALIYATLLSSQNGGVSLAAVGGVDRSFQYEDWGFSVGPCVSFAISKNIYLTTEARVRAWDKREMDVLVTAGVGFSF